jgi:hypothetical protein
MDNLIADDDNIASNGVGSRRTEYESLEHNRKSEIRSSLHMARPVKLTCQIGSKINVIHPILCCGSVSRGEA